MGSGCARGGLGGLGASGVVRLDAVGRRWRSAGGAGQGEGEFASNVTPAIMDKVPRKLHLQENQPLNLVKGLIEQYFQAAHPGLFSTHDDLDPVVTTQACFDDLLIEADHPSRRMSDTYFLTPETLLRTHTSAHQTQLMRAGEHAFLLTGDCYRRDEIDSSHYPIFHQMEGVRLFEPGTPIDDVVADLKTSLEGMVHAVFQEVDDVRWVDEYFPFTDPSMELEILFRGEWLEVLGCGAIQPKILQSCGLDDRIGWAFGLGLERLAMVLFDIPDIRLFWSQDRRFLDQFKDGSHTPDGKLVQFKPFSKFPPVFKDVSLWKGERFHEHDLFDLVRSHAGDLVEEVQLVDQFEDTKNQRSSVCYRIVYRSMDRSLTHEEIDSLQESLRERIASTLEVELR